MGTIQLLDVNGKAFEIKVLKSSTEESMAIEVRNEIGTAKATEKFEDLSPEVKVGDLVHMRLACSPTDLRVFYFDKLMATLTETHHTTSNGVGSPSISAVKTNQVKMTILRISYEFTSQAEKDYHTF